MATEVGNARVRNTMGQLAWLWPCDAAELPHDGQQARTTDLITPGDQTDRLIEEAPYEASSLGIDL